MRDTDTRYHHRMRTMTTYPRTPTLCVIDNGPTNDLRNRTIVDFMALIVVDYGTLTGVTGVVLNIIVCRWCG